MIVFTATCLYVSCLLYLVGVVTEAFPILAATSVVCAFVVPPICRWAERS